GLSAIRFAFGGGRFRLNIPPFGVSVVYNGRRECSSPLDHSRDRNQYCARRCRERRVMKTAVHTWISKRWAYNTSSAYGRTLPMLSMAKFLAAAFITFCAVGFAIDLLLVNYQPLGRGFFWPIYFGTLGTAVFEARMKRTRLVP